MCVIEPGFSSVMSGLLAVSGSLHIEVIWIEFSWSQIKVTEKWGNFKGAIRAQEELCLCVLWQAIKEFAPANGGLSFKSPSLQ